MQVMSTPQEPTDSRQRILDTARKILASKGFSAVGLNEILSGARVPKGSFYHYFASKEEFGEALLQQYFAGYLARTEAILVSSPGNPGQRLLNFCQHWRSCYVDGDVHDQCLVVKLGAEVSDLSDAMRTILRDGTDRIIGLLAACLEQGRRDGSLPEVEAPAVTAASLYQLWLGATLLSKFTRDSAPLDGALEATRRLLRLPPVAIRTIS